MIDEEKQDQLIAHLLGSLEPDTGRELEAEMSADAELATLADELRESIGALAHAAPLQRPPPHVRAKVLAAARGEIAAPALIAPRKPSRMARVPDWMPWAIAAGIAVAALIQFASRERFRAESVRLRAESEAAHREADTLRERNAALEAESRSLTGQTAQLQQELSTLKKRDALSEVRIATLTAQVTGLLKAGAVIVWDADQQRGIVKLTNVPKAAAGKDYQLWVIDPKYPTPVSGGVITVGAGGSAYVSFSPDKPISAANKFAISVERTGGAAAPAGPIVFLGD